MVSFAVVNQILCALVLGRNMRVVLLMPLSLFKKIKKNKKYRQRGEH